MDNTDQPISVTVGLPVTVTYDPATGEFVVSPDMTEFYAAVTESSLGAADADGDAMAALWAAWHSDHRVIFGAMQNPR